MGSIVEESEIESNSFASIPAFQLKFFAIVDENKPQMLPHVLIHPHNLSAQQGLEEPDSMGLGENLLFLKAGLSCKEFVVVLV